MKRIKGIIIGLLVVILLLPATVSSAVAFEPFSDLDGYGWAKESVENLHSSGLIKGVGNGKFNPSGYLRVAEMAMTLYRIAGSPKTEKTWENYKIRNIDPNGILYPSSDVWYYDCAVWAVENGIVELTIADVPIFHAITRAFPKQENNMFFATGEWYEDIGVGEHFPSYRRIRRGDAVISMFFYAEYAGKDTSPQAEIPDFSDYDNITDRNWSDLYPVNDIAYRRTDTREFEETHIRDYLSWAVANGILKGYPDGSLRPFESVTRAEYAVMLERFIDYLNK
ncbi:MAG: S-layer homology domain-containing protein [Clostridia bacterium]|nr:S-layer homology domain-containing protein [Clostridia bacterium]